VVTTEDSLDEPYNGSTRIIYDLVTFLIDALYIPSEDRVKIADYTRIRYFKINYEHEPINWGNLRVEDILEFKDGSFLVTIGEASAGYCPTFCKYIERYMDYYGWKVSVMTEW